MRTKSLVIPAVAAAILFAAQSTPSPAAAIKFDDTTETVTATLDGKPVTDTCVSENVCAVLLLNFLQNPVNKTYQAQYSLTEPGAQGEISDVIKFVVNLATPQELDVFFFSDPITASLSSEFYGSTDEIGDFQTIPLPNNLPPLAAGATLTVQAASEIEKVSEPGSLQLVACALFGLGGLSLVSKGGSTVLGRFRRSLVGRRAAPPRL